MRYISDVRTKNSSNVRQEPTFIEAARRTQIIEAAIGTVAELGFGNASLAQIAKRAGISKSVIGYYFPTKDDLVRQAVDYFYGTGHSTMMEQVQNVSSPTEMLRIYISSNIDYIDKNRTATLAMGDIIANFRGPDGELVYKPQDEEPLIAGTEALFKWGQETGEFRLFDARIMAVTLRRAIDAFATQLQMNPELDIPHYVAELTDLFLAAARNPSRPTVQLRREQQTGGSKA